MTWCSCKASEVSDHWIPAHSFPCLEKQSMIELTLETVAELALVAEITAKWH